MNGNTGNSFCKLKRNYCWINCKVKETTHEKEATIKEIVNKHLTSYFYEWKYFHDNLFVKLKQVTETSDKKEATVREVVKNHLIIKIFLPKENVKKQLLKISSIII